MRREDALDFSGCNCRPQLARAGFLIGGTCEEGLTVNDSYADHVGRDANQLCPLSPKIITGSW